MKPSRFFLFAILFEAGLGVLAIFFCFLSGIPLREGMTLGRRDLMLVGAGTTVMLLGYVVLRVLPLECFRKIERLLREMFQVYFRPLSSWQLLAIGLAAGFGEELFFRGFLQTGLLGLLGHLGLDSDGPPALSLAVFSVSLLFGLGHAMTKTYFVLAILISIYLGTIYIATENLLIPILIHALYDVIVLLWIAHESEA